MKKRWRPFLFKLFLPGVLALPWLLDVPLEFLPVADFERDLELYSFASIWSKPLAFCLFLFAIVSPLIFFRQKPRSIKRILIPAWLISIGIFAANQWTPFDSFINDALSTSLSVCGGIVLASPYLFLAIKSNQYHLQNFRLHSLCIFISVCIGMALVLLGEFEDIIAAMDNSVFNDIFKVFEMLAGLLFLGFVASAISHYITSIRHFKHQINSVDSLIDEIGRS